MDFVKKLVQHDTFSGLLLLAAALVAIVFSNTSLSAVYEAFLACPLGLKLGNYTISAPVTFWINEALMTLFFMLIGLEVRKAWGDGAFKGGSAVLPLAAAVGGVIVPAVIYITLNWGSSTLRGWAIPTATDIAFSLAVLSLLGKRIHPWLKFFLMSVAVIDDVIAVLIIAVFYTNHLVYPALAIAVVALVALVGLNRYGVQGRKPYIILGIILWVAVLASGVHATVAGVAIGLLLPRLQPAPGKPSLADRATHALDPWVAYLILPLFAFSNSGIGLGGLRLDHFMQPLPLGIALGLFFGKQIGIGILSWLLLRTGRAVRPPEITALEFHGVSILAGIGFTMSLFIGVLAFSDPGAQFYTRLGVIMGSLLSAVVGYGVIRFAVKRKTAQG